MPANTENIKSKPPPVVAFLRRHGAAYNVNELERLAGFKPLSKSLHKAIAGRRGMPADNLAQLARELLALSRAAESAARRTLEALETHTETPPKKAAENTGN